MSTVAKAASIDRHSEGDVRVLASALEVGKLIFTRRGTWLDLLRPYDIFVDGVLRGRLKWRGELSLEVPPGAHECQARIVATGSAVTKVNVLSGQTTNVHVKHGTEGSLMERAVSADEYLLLEIGKNK